jgi:hypothetical protein
MQTHCITTTKKIVGTLLGADEYGIYGLFLVFLAELFLVYRRRKKISRRKKTAQSTHRVRSIR